MYFDEKKYGNYHPHHLPDGWSLTKNGHANHRATGYVIKCARSGKWYYTNGNLPLDYFDFFWQALQKVCELANAYKAPHDPISAYVDRFLSEPFDL